MSVPAWQVTTWNPVCLTPRQWSRSSLRLKPLSASINIDSAGGGIRHGQVLWAGDCDGELVGMAWDWRELRKDVIAMADPMMVLSNLRLLDEAGVEVSDSHRMICLNSAIYRLHWQEQLGTHHASDHLRMAA